MFLVEPVVNLIWPVDVRAEEEQAGEARPSKAERRYAIALKVAVFVAAMLVLYVASAGLGTVVAGMAAKNLVVAWKFGALNGAILGLKASMVAVPIIATKCNMFRYTKTTRQDIVKFLKWSLGITALLTAAGTSIGAYNPKSMSEFMGYYTYRMSHYDHVGYVNTDQRFYGTHAFHVLNSDNFMVVSNNYNDYRSAMDIRRSELFRRYVTDHGILAFRSLDLNHLNGEWGSRAIGLILP